MKIKKIFILLILLIPAIFAGGIVKAEAVEFRVFAKKAGTSNSEKIAGVKYEIYQDSCSSGTKLFSDTTQQGDFTRHSIESGTTICIKPTGEPPLDYKLPGEEIITVTGSNSSYGIILEEKTNKTKIVFAYAITDKTDGHMIDSGKIRIKKGGVKNNKCIGTDEDIILAEGDTSSTPVRTDNPPYEFTTAPSKVCIELIKEIAGYQYPAAQEFTVDSDLVNTYLVLDKKSTDEPSGEKTTYQIGLKAKDTSKYLSGKITITDGTIENGSCSGTSLISEYFVPGLAQTTAQPKSTTGHICIEVISLDNTSYKKPEPKEFTYEDDGTYEIEVEKKDGGSTVTHPTIKVGFKYKDKYVKGIQFSISEFLDPKNKCGNPTLTDSKSISGLQSLVLGSLEEMPSSVCIYVYQESLGNYSVKEHALYTVKNGVVEIELGDKVISPDTMSNVSIIVISVGLIALILGSYLLYTNKINKEENSTEN